MPFLGYTPDNTFHTLSKQTITGDGGTSYTLTNPVVGSNDIEVFVNNVRQEPSVAYTASGTSIVFTSAVQSSDSIYVVYQGKALGLNTVQDNTISTIKMVDGAVTADKLNSTLDLSGKTISNFATTGRMGVGTEEPACALDVRSDVDGRGRFQVADSAWGSHSLTHSGSGASYSTSSPIYIKSQTYFGGNEWFGWSTYFPHNVSNLAIRLYCGAFSWWGSGEILMGSSFSYANASGFRRYLFTHNQNGGSNYNNDTTNTDNQGSMTSHFEFHSHGYDSTEGAHYWEFRHLASSGNGLRVQFRGFGNARDIGIRDYYIKYGTY